jgi:5'-deoxynucleotidase YfbR-like HD superfamily hydrolase
MQSAGDVKRFHTHNIIGENTVAHHSWGVCVLILELVGPNPPVDLLRAAIYHDAFEVITGDIPYTAKQRSPELKSIADEMEKAAALEVDVTFNMHPWEEHVLKFCDMLDLMWFCVKQRRLGHTKIEEVFKNGTRYLLGNINSMDQYPETAEKKERASGMYDEVAREFYDV